MRAIKENIVRLELAPGSMVSENEIAAQLGLSRTPVREALIDLSKAGIVEIYPQRGSAISLIDYTQVEETRFMRLVLKKAVVELDCQMATDGDIRELRECVKLYGFHIENASGPDTLLQTDNQFHRLLFHIAKKELVYSLIQVLSIHFDRVRRMSLTAVKDQKVLQDHQAIVDAIAKRDAAEAMALMEKHLTRYKIDETAIRAQYPDYFKP